MTKKVELGNKVKDRVSGFTGIMVGRTSYLQGCDRCAVQPPVNKDGTLPEMKHFDEPDLVFVDGGVIPNVTKGNPGGPRSVSPSKEM